MINAFKEGKDIYAIFSQSAFNNKYEDNLEFYPEGTKIILDGKEIICGYKTHKNMEGKKRRGVGKVINLAVTYGMGAGSLAVMTNKTYQEGVDLLESFFKGFPVLKKWIDDNIEFAKKYGYVEGLLGRKRHLKDIQLPPYTVRYKKDFKPTTVFNPFLICENGEDPVLKKWKKACEKEMTFNQFKKIKEQASKENVDILSNSGFIATAVRQTSNAIIQGSAATMTKIAMINIFNDKELNDLGFKLLITVHDEVLGECPKCNEDRVEKRLVEVMCDSLKPYLAVPIACDTYVVPCWYYDELGTEVREEYESYLEGDEEKGIKPMSREDAYDKIKQEHIELLENQIKDMLNIED